VAAERSGNDSIWEKRKLTSWTVPFQHNHLLLPVGCSLREYLPCWQARSCNYELHKCHFHSWSSHFHQIRVSWLGPIRESWFGLTGPECETYKSSFGPIPIRLVAFISALFPQCLFISPGEEAVPGKEIRLVMISKLKVLQNFSVTNSSVDCKGIVNMNCCKIIKTFNISAPGFRRSFYMAVRTESWHLGPEKDLW
jgi:hypothetical protein